MKKFFAILLTVAMLATVLAVSVSAAGVIDSTTGVLPENFTTESAPGVDLNVKVSDITHKYAADIIFTPTDLLIGGTITWNVNTMKYDVAGATLANTTQKVKVSNRSDLPIYSYATISETDDDDGITIEAVNGAGNKLKIDKATAGAGVNEGSPTMDELTINITSGNWNAVAEYYAAKRLNSTNQATDTFKIATVTVTITKEPS